MKTLVLIHGNSQDSKVFNELQIPNVRLHHVTLPGHGGVPIGPVKSFLDLVDAIQDELKSEDEIVFCGFSLGGHIVHHLLDKVPSLGFITLCAPPISPEPAGQAFLPHPLSATLFGKELSAGVAEELSMILASSEVHRDYLARAIRETDPKIREFIGKSLMAGEFRDELALIRAYSGKKLLILASEDVLVNNAYVTVLDVAAVEIVEGKHTLLLDNPVATQELIESFLADLG
jgi:pimeloyl-ACP methyl ester carboxylesterase